MVQLDADDWLEPTALERILEVLDTAASVVAVYANPIIHYPDGAVVRQRGYTISGAADIVTHRPPQVPRAYRVSALRSAGGWPTDDAAAGRYYEDRRMLIRMSTYGVVHHLDTWLYNVRRRRDSLSEAVGARLAKFAILTSEANRLGKSVSVTHPGTPLRCEFVPRRSSPPRGPWSVVIPIRNRNELLALTLRSWVESDWGASGSEIIIVDDASGDRPAIPSGFDDRIRVIRSNIPHGPAWARNRGAREARHGMLLFADCDHIVPPDILGVHQWYHDHAEAPTLVIGGAFERRVLTRFRGSEIGSERVDRFLAVIRHHPRYAEIASAVGRDDSVTIADEQTPDLWRTLLPFTFVDEAGLDWADLLLRQGHDLTTFPQTWRCVRSINLSVAANLFADLGGFDESLPGAAWTLGVRAQKRGVRIVVALEAETYHQVHARDRKRRRPFTSSLEPIRGKESRARWQGSGAAGDRMSTRRSWL